MRGIVTLLHGWISNGTVTLSTQSFILLLSPFSPSGILGSAVRFIYAYVNASLALCRNGYVSK
jgi:hypothetical protein